MGHLLDVNEWYFQDLEFHQVAKHWYQLKSSVWPSYRLLGEIAIPKNLPIHTISFQNTQFRHVELHVRQNKLSKNVVAGEFINPSVASGWPKLNPFRMVHMPSLPDTPENRNGTDNVLVNTPYCSTSQYKCADKQLDYLVFADNSVCVYKTPCAITRWVTVSNQQNSEWIQIIRLL